MPSKSTSGAATPLSERTRSALKARIAGELELPHLPDTAARIMAACQNERSDTEQLAALITHDQSLAVHMLRVANSAVYAPREPIVSLQQALGRLGLKTVSEIAIAVSLKGSVFAVPGYKTRLRSLWMHSAAAAVYAKEVGICLRQEMESAFLCGLLHDVGMPLTMQVLCDLAKEQGESLVPPAIMEAAMMEFHRELGARIVETWRLGPALSSAIRFHHDSAEAVSHQVEVLATSLADELAYWALDEQKEAKDFPPELPQVASLGLSEQHLASLLAKRERVLKITDAFL